MTIAGANLSQTGSRHIRAASSIASPEPLVLRVLMSCLAVIAAFAVVHGPFTNLDALRTPWHHDDFMLIYDARLYAFSFWMPRPVSLNWAKLTGSYDHDTYYAAYMTVWIAALVLTHQFVLKGLNLRLTLAGTFLSTLMGSLIWFSLQPSYQVLQSSGLVTNQISYLFAFGSGLALLSADGLIRRFGVAGYGAVLFVTTSLAAFAKEDMVLLLLICAAYRFVSDLIAQRNAEHRLNAFALSAGIITLCYALSFAHAIAISSPFIGGGGTAYSLSNWVANVSHNLAYYLAVSRASAFLLAASFVFAIILTAVAVRRSAYRKIALYTMFLQAATLGAMAPYLILPRNFDFYGVSYLPLVAFSVAPSALATSTLVFAHRETWYRAIAAAAIMLPIFASAWILDRHILNGSLHWMKFLREESARQIDETRRAYDMGLAKCSEVVVRGVEDIGPYLSTSAEHLNQMLGAKIRWRIVTKDGTRLRVWSKSRAFQLADWQYVDESEDPPSIDASPCMLSYNTKLRRFE